MLFVQSFSVLIFTFFCFTQLFNYRLGLAYAGSNRPDIVILLSPVLTDAKSNMEVRDLNSSMNA